MFSKKTGYLFRKKNRHDNNYYKQALVVAQYQFLIRCYSAMFRNEIYLEGSLLHSGPSSF